MGNAKSQLFRGVACGQFRAASLFPGNRVPVAGGRNAFLALGAQDRQPRTTLLSTLHASSITDIDPASPREPVERCSGQPFQTQDLGPFLEWPGALSTPRLSRRTGGSRILPRFSPMPSRFQLRAPVSPLWLTGVSPSKFRRTVKLQCICKKSPSSRHFTFHELPLNPSSRPKFRCQQPVN
jgi:hypothetical protein